MQTTWLSPRLLALVTLLILPGLALSACDGIGPVASVQQAPALSAQATPSQPPALADVSSPTPVLPLDTPAPQPPATDTAVAPTSTPPPPPPPLPSPPPPTDTLAPVPTDTPVPPTEAALVATEAPASPTDVPAQSIETPLPADTPALPARLEAPPTQVVVNGVAYDAYNQAAVKQHQYYHYTCEFDAAWVVLKTYGFDVTLEDQLSAIGQDTSIEPRWEETKDGIFIYGGDILHSYSGDYKTNFLARSTGQAMAKVFERYGLQVTPVHSQQALEDALLQGDLVWIKTTADFKPGRPATWVMPDGETYQTVLGNDHAAVVMGFNSDGALIRDVLGPTTTNWNRQYEYLVPWPKFLAAWAQQQNDGLAVAPPRG